MHAEVLPDALLVARCRQGDGDAWRELVQRYSRYVYAIAIQAFRLEEHEAEDVFQEVFARVYENLDKLRDDDAIRPWIAQVTRRLCINRLRGAGREQPSEQDVEIPDPDDTLERLDESITIHDALARLPEHCREILDRFFARDESYRQIGDTLDLPAGTIASRISRCLKKLRDDLEEETSSPRGPEDMTPNRYDEERLAQLIAALPPAPEGWVLAAQELPAARAELDRIVARAEEDAAFRRALIADLEATLTSEGVEPVRPLVDELRRRLRD